MCLRRGDWVGGRFDILLIVAGGVVDCEDELTAMERGAQERCAGARAMAGGNIRATAVPGLGSLGERSRRKLREGLEAQQGLEGGGVRACGVHAMQRRRRSYWLCPVIGLCTNIACTLRANNWNNNRCCGEFLVYLVLESNYSIRRIATAIADSISLAPYAVSYVYNTLCARERLRSTSRVLVAEMALLHVCDCLSPAGPGYHVNQCQQPYETRTQKTGLTSKGSRNHRTCIRNTLTLLCMR